MTKSSINSNMLTVIVVQFCLFKMADSFEIPPHMKRLTSTLLAKWQHYSTKLEASPSETSEIASCIGLLDVSNSSHLAAGDDVIELALEDRPVPSVLALPPPVTRSSSMAWVDSEQPFAMVLCDVSEEVDACGIFEKLKRDVSLGEDSCNMHVHA